MFDTSYKLYNIRIFVQSCCNVHSCPRLGLHITLPVRAREWLLPSASLAPYTYIHFVLDNFYSKVL